MKGNELEKTMNNVMKQRVYAEQSRNQRMVPVIMEHTFAINIFSSIHYHFYRLVFLDYFNLKVPRMPQFNP